MPRRVVLFPGQGAYVPGALAALAETEPSVGEVLTEVDRAAVRLGRGPVSRLLLDTGAPTLGELVTSAPQDLHLAIFASEIALFRLLTGRFGVEPDVLLGHSFGELVALVAAGVHDLEHGVALVVARDEAFAACPPAAGGMVALEVSAARAAHLLAALAEGEVCVAADNGPRQCVVSGPGEPLERVRKAAEAVGITATGLRVPYAFHSHGLAGVAHDFADRVRELAARPARYRLYSAILGRYVDDGAHTALVAAHLVRPTRFADAVRALHADGAEEFVECGPKGVLSDLMTSIAPGVRAVAPLRRRVGVGEFAATLGAEAPVAAPREASPPDTPHGELVGSLRELYADALGYPPEVLTGDADLEADLGVDSIKQVELFSQALERHGRRLPPDGSRLTNHTTLDALAELLLGLPTAAGVR
ncbi:acyltransferase domain-containing protein [Streptomyces sp. NPDC004539]|uniref:acyltransferase domain-containing protein n=1 Tax=Streptomyces sp. NPDC004539 TaxID=3154280 RepID=UPI0033B1A980